jgi:hypothetical protein
MAVATGTALALGSMALQAGGSAYNAYQQSQAAKAQNARQDAILQQAAGMRQYGMGDVEKMLLNLYNTDANSPGVTFNPTQLDLGGILKQGGYNVGQDALMQMLRSTPDSNLNRSLNSVLSGQGNPFDTSKMFEALGTVDRRNTNQQVADLRGGSGGLGQRFGSAMTGAETALRGSISADLNSRNAQIQAGSHESAQTRLLQAAAQLAARDQFQAGLAGTVRQGGMDLSQLFMQNNAQNNASSAQAASMNQQNRNFGAQLLQLLLGAETNRNNFNLQTLGLGAGMQAAVPQYGYGNAASDFGQLLMFMQMMNGFGGQRPATGSTGGR